jgi:hypothetical protein
MVSPCRFSRLSSRAVSLRTGEVVRRVRYRVSAVRDRDDEEGSTSTSIAWVEVDVRSLQPRSQSPHAKRSDLALTARRRDERIAAKTTKGTAGTLKSYSLPRRDTFSMSLTTRRRSINRTSSTTCRS